MTKRSHAASVVIFFLVGILSGMVIVTKTKLDRSLDLFGRARELNLRWTSEEVLSNQLYTDLSMGMRWLEDTAAGKEAQAMEQAISYLRSGLARLKCMAPPQAGPVEQLSDRLAAWDAGTPYVWRTAEEFAAEQAQDG
jgi:hypothetical protein